MQKLDKEERQHYINQVREALTRQDTKIFKDLFLQLHPSDQAETVLTLPKKERAVVYKMIVPAEFAEIFQELELGHQKHIFAELHQNYAIEMLNEMYSDDVVDFLAELPKTTKELYLSKMDKDDVQDILRLLKYPEQTAGTLMTTEFIAVSSSDTVSDVLDQLRVKGPEAETIYYLYVIDQQLQLVGVMSLRDLIISPADKHVQDVMQTRIVSVETNTDQEEVANIIKKYDFLALPVTEGGKLAGIITIDDVLDVLEEETEEDFGEISAARGSLDANISSFSAARKRAPWILILMFLGLITAGVIGQFEETLEAVVLLAVFIPLIMDSAGNTGTQALAVVVRGLALGTVESSNVKKMIKREFGTGIMLGLICAVTLIVVVPLIYGSIWLAVIVGTSIFLTLSIATMVGSIVPLIINRLKIDPAVASGPFITTINDIMGLIIYFSIASALLQYLPH